MAEVMVDAPPTCYCWRMWSGLAWCALAFAPVAPGERPPVTEADMWRETGENLWHLRRGLVTGTAVLELAVPDLRLELADGDERWLLSFPLVLQVHGGRPGPLEAQLHAFLEPQFLPSTRTLRGLAGLRGQAVWEGLGLGLLGEAGVLAGADGHGAMLGFGPTFAPLREPLSVSLVSRWTTTTEGDRWDFSVDLEVPLNWISTWF